MNLAILTGRLTKIPSITATNDYTIARFTLAVDRFKKDAGADFISCVAFGKTAEFTTKYLTKGTKVNVVGRIQTGSYEKDGRKIYTTDVVVETIEFAESKKKEQKEEPEDDFVNVPEGVDEELPFA